MKTSFIKSGPVAFLRLLSLRPYLTTETTQHKIKNACKAFIGESKGAQASKARRHAGT